MNVKRSAVRAAAQVIVTLTGCATLAAIVAILAVLPYISPGRTASGATTAPSVVIPLRAIPRGWKQEEQEVPDTFWQSMDGDFGAVASWSDGVPSGGVQAIADGRSQVSMISNLNRGAATFDLVTTPAYRGDIGSPSNPLIHSAGTNALITIRGSGRAYLQPGDGTVVIDSTNLIDAATITGTPDQALTIKQGGTIFSGGLSSGNQIIVVGALATLTIESNASLPTFMTLDAGRVVCAAGLNSPNGVLAVNGGILDMTGDIASTYMINVNGGTLRFRPTSRTACSANLTIAGGLVDVSDNEFAAFTGTIIIGPNGDIQGPIGATLTPTRDLREDYP